MFNLIESVLQQDRYQNQKNKILQIGPGEDTLEIQLRAIKNDEKDYFISNSDSSIFYDCDNCPHRFICKKGKQVVSGGLDYQSVCFHKIVLLANSCFGCDSPIQKALPFLLPKGNLILFVHREKAKNTVDEFSFALDAILPKINLNELEIQSITNMKIYKEDIMCLIASKL